MDVSNGMIQSGEENNTVKENSVSRDTMQISHRKAEKCIHTKPGRETPSDVVIQFSSLHL